MVLLFCWLLLRGNFLCLWGYGYGFGAFFFLDASLRLRADTWFCAFFVVVVVVFCSPRLVLGNSFFVFLFLLGGGGTLGALERLLLLPLSLSWTPCATKFSPLGWLVLVFLLSLIFLQKIKGKPNKKMKRKGTYEISVCVCVCIMVTTVHVWLVHHTYRVEKKFPGVPKPSGRSQLLQGASFPSALRQAIWPTTDLSLYFITPAGVYFECAMIHFLL